MYPFTNYFIFFNKFLGFKRLGFSEWSIQFLRKYLWILNLIQQQTKNFIFLLLKFSFFIFFFFFIFFPFFNEKTGVRFSTPTVIGNAIKSSQERERKLISKSKKWMNFIKNWEFLVLFSRK